MASSSTTGVLNGLKQDKAEHDREKDNIDKDERKQL
jgi:hypothetical protein